MNFKFPDWFSKLRWPDFWGMGRAAFVPLVQGCCGQPLAFSVSSPAGGSGPASAPSGEPGSPTPGSAPPGKKKGLPRWLLWVGLGVVAVCLISTVVALVTSGGMLLWFNRQKDTPEPVVVGVETVEPDPLTVTEEIEIPLGTVQVNSVDNADMAYVPAGAFPMGLSDDELDWLMAQDWELELERDNFFDEQPQHTVTLDEYWIYVYEVTNAQYADFLNAMGNQTEGGAPWYDLESGMGQIAEGEIWAAEAGYASFPVIEVTWFGAKAYCQWAGGRLPTEAEWEKAARGAEGRRFPWGDALPDCTRANFGTCEDGTVQVGRYPAGASGCGALDMAGNAAEWVSDWYGESYYGSAPVDNPSGPPSGEYRVIRGGAWILYGWFQMTTSRVMNGPAESDIMTGFRCVVDGS